MILICGFSPDFFKRKTLTHHYPLCVVCLFYHCPSPGGVPLFANVETRFTGLGGSGEGSVLRHSTPVPFWVQILSQAPGQTDVLGGRTEVGNPPCLVVFRVFQFCFGFLFHFFFPFPSSPGIMRHVLVNVMQWTSTKTHLVSATQFFLMQYIHL